MFFCFGLNSWFSNISLYFQWSEFHINPYWYVQLNILLNRMLSSFCYTQEQQIWSPFSNMWLIFSVWSANMAKCVTVYIIKLHSFCCLRESCIYILLDVCYSFSCLGLLELLWVDCVRPILFIGKDWSKINAGWHIYSSTCLLARSEAMLHFIISCFEFKHHVVRKSDNT